MKTRSLNKRCIIRWDFRWIVYRVQRKDLEDRKLEMSRSTVKVMTHENGVQKVRQTLHRQRALRLG